jgi:uncharacterized membrane protein
LVTKEKAMIFRAEDRPLISAGLALGIGMGGFVDGILFHQILQSHGMLSARRAPDSVVNMEINMFWDGLFHVFTWTMTAVGIWLLFRAAGVPQVNWSGKILFGAMLAGWGLFNLLEGIVDHHILHVHHVIERLGESIWDFAFLASGLILILLGAWMVASAEPEPNGRNNAPSSPSQTPLR